MGFNGALGGSGGGADDVLGGSGGGIAVGENYT